MCARSSPTTTFSLKRKMGTSVGRSPTQNTKHWSRWSIDVAHACTAAWVEDRPIQPCSHSTPTDSDGVFPASLDLDMVEELCIRQSVSLSCTLLDKSVCRVHKSCTDKINDASNAEAEGHPPDSDVQEEQDVQSPSHEFDGRSSEK